MKEAAETGIWNAEQKEADLNALIEQRAQTLAAPICEEAARQEAAAREMQEKMHQQIQDQTDLQTTKIRKMLQLKERLYAPYLFVTFSYSFLVTWFVSLSSVQCRETWHAWLESIGSFFLMFWNWLLGAATWAAQVSRYVPDADCAIVVHWLIVASVIGGIAVSTVIGIRKAGRRFVRFYRTWLADRLSMLVYIGTTAGCLFFAESIQNTVHINAIWVAIMTAAGYVLARSFWIKKYHCVNQRGVQL